ncbi:tRNA (5-methylaminomethyl-2-thiouridine)(34)-methyltransferase MnmD [Seohaeicola zhoushanensis]|uniref:FAD-dependent oxidoreductase n=1 Tax=Seohaeicola zhoushanensis TaxID=1569283 RepID=A0A8J3GVA6_9RHOB|nr:tRNA (5-methylaminomethyl-2-thiouridine)(34)-methyltransferase MnmD [Seohaeicola zhoushanensis]GHF43054.1 FAD-dependent oxidoreductase [Seohaeicola zhoushanensis]
MDQGKADIDWREGRIPVSRRFDDPYFSLDNGLEETRHVFHAGNLLPERFRDGFHIAELGFGTGLNLLATVQAWGQREGQLLFTSFEAFPMSADEMAQALAAFPELAPLVPGLLSGWRPEGGSWEVAPGVTLRLVAGDARVTLPQWEGRADAWFLDGFSPAKNPELWEPSLIAEVARHTAPGGTAASYTAAGHVRRALAEAGFTVERIPGFGRKRHMTRARMA